jgi:quercetin dioxygenase-like cupin family protein
MFLKVKNIGGEVVKDNETYVLKDNKHLKNLVVSSTQLRPHQETRGHRHPGQEEVYYFISGTGKMQLNDNAPQDVGPGDVVLIEDGAFHKVYNTSEVDLYFVCVFDGKRNH